MEKVQYEAKQNHGILMNANESYENVDATYLQEIQEAMASIAFNRYPDDDCTALREAYGNYINISPEHILAGNGSDEMLGLIISLTIKQGKKLFTLSPDFTMYDYYTSMANGELVKYAYDVEATFDVEDFIEQGRRQKIDMILFSNPNNPTGKEICQSDLLKIVEAFPRCPVVIDEAYADFSEQSMLQYIDTYQNLMVLRTMSKAFGMASIRCGFLITGTCAMSQIRPFKVPYNVNSMTQAIACIALAHTQHTKTFLENVKTARDAFYQEYKACALKDIVLYPSCANYIYGKTTKKQSFLNALALHDISIRDYSDETTFRITIGTKAQNDLVLKCIKDVFMK